MASVTITEDQPLILKVDGLPFVRRTVQVYPDRLAYQGMEYKFDQVQHVWWSAMRTIVNFGMSTTLTQVLKLFIRGRSDPVVLKQEIVRYFEREYRGSLGAAYDFIAGSTFDERTKAYLDQLEARGFFLYEGAEIWSDGRVRYGHKTYAVSDLDYSGLVMMKRQPGSLDIEPGIAFNLDRDAVAAVLRGIAS